jgi:hypothetical protein
MPPSPPIGHVTPPDFKQAIESARQAGLRAAVIRAEAVRVCLEVQETLAAVRSAREHR